MQSQHRPQEDDKANHLRPSNAPHNKGAVPSESLQKETTPSHHPHPCQKSKSRERLPHSSPPKDENNQGGDQDLINLRGVPTLAPKFDRPRDRAGSAEGIPAGEMREPQSQTENGTTGRQGVQCRPKRQALALSIDPCCQQTDEEYVF